MQKPLTVVVGQLENVGEIKTDAGDTVKLGDWGGRALWSFLRLVYGRSIDDKIKAVHKDDRDEYLYQLLKKAQQKTPLQFILTASDNDVKAVASTKHLLVQPEQVYKTAAEILGDSLEIETNIDGGIFYTGQFAGIRTGYQIDGGDLTTRFAVRVGVFARVKMCFNPLSWLGVGNLNRFAIPGDYERVLRVKKLNELFPRLQAALTNAKEKLGDLETRVNQARETDLSPKMALLLNGAMCSAYKLGEKTIKSVMDQYKKEDSTLYGLAMAQSWQAQHGEHRKTPKGCTNRVPQSLSTISGATLLIENPTIAYAKSKVWLKGQSSPLAKKLLKGKLP